MDISSLREARSQAPFSVSELNGYIKNIFENDRILSAISVKGEISNFTNHRSGHLYFSLKDETGQIRAVMFRSSAVRLKFVPENGMRVVVRGSVSVYTRDGSYQLYVNSIEPDGIGALYLAYEQLKEKLSLEGLFDEEHKKPLPKFPEKIGVITSPTGAAVRDIINVTKRRYPLAKIYIYPALVQGEGAVDSLIRALEYFEASRLVDVIIIGRGGGSIEDLWAFNSEKLARKIYAISTPIISAVGHETDFTICDFVADLRAPTPSAGAEIAVPDLRELIMRVDGSSERLSKALVRLAEQKRERLEKITESDIFKNPSFILVDKREAVYEAFGDISALFKLYFERKSTLLSLQAEKLNALSPLAVMDRGYSITEKDGQRLSSVCTLKQKDIITVRLTDGTATAEVKDVKKS